MKETPIFQRLLTSKWLLLLAVVPSIIGLFVEIIEPDGALYASISKNIVTTGDFINLKVQGNDWLDKPHLPFWIAAVFFKILGISAFSYKLPAVLSTLLAAYFTYNTSKLYFSKEISFVASLLFLSSLHITLSNIDVRAEAYLCFFTIAAFYHIEKFRLKNSLAHLVYAALFTSFCIMTKGIFTLLPILSGQFIYFLFNRKWKELFSWHWALFCFIVIIGILPELISLYIQFDLHPEKIVFGKTHVSGLRFFFWDSQFGRFFNTGPIKGSGDLFFYLHTLLWAFLPFSFILLISLFSKIKGIVLSKEISADTIPLLSALVTFVIFSISKFQLPHYTNILFPFFAMTAAGFIVQKKIGSRIFNRYSIIVSLLLLIAITALLLFTNWSGKGVVILLPCLVTLLLLIHYSQPSNYKKGLLIGVISISLITSILALSIYPQLFKYQAGMNAGKYITKNRLQKFSEVYCIETNSYSLDFYCEKDIKYANNVEDIKQRNSYLAFVEKQWLDTKKMHLGNRSIKSIASFPYFRISMLNFAFLNPATRFQETTYFELVEISPLKH